MIIDKKSIEINNEPLLKEHERRFKFAAEGLNDAEGVIKKLAGFYPASKSIDEMMLQFA